MVEAEQQEIDDELEEIKRLIDIEDAANTKRITKLAYNVFSSVVDVAAAEKDLASLDKLVARFFGNISNSPRSGSINDKNIKDLKQTTFLSTWKCAD